MDFVPHVMKDFEKYFKKIRNNEKVANETIHTMQLWRKETILLLKRL